MPSAPIRMDVEEVVSSANAKSTAFGDSEIMWEDLVLCLISISHSESMAFNSSIRIWPYT